MNHGDVVIEVTMAEPESLRGRNQACMVNQSFTGITHSHRICETPTHEASGFSVGPIRAPDRRRYVDDEVADFAESKRAAPQSDLRISATGRIRSRRCLNFWLTVSCFSHMHALQIDGITRWAVHSAPSPYSRQQACTRGLGSAGKRTHVIPKQRAWACGAACRCAFATDILA